MKARPDDVRRLLPGELNDQLAEVGFVNVDAGRLEVFVDLDFFRRHRLRLHDCLSPCVLHQVSDVPVCVLCVLGQVDGTAVLDHALA